MERRCSEASGSSDSSARWSDWKSDVPDEPIVSFLGPHVHSSADAAWQELLSATGFDYTLFAAQRKLDGYARVRLINFLRRVGNDTESLRKATSPSALAHDASLWSDDSLLAPVLPDDALIMDVLGFDDEGDVEGADGQGPVVSVQGVVAEASLVDSVRAATSQLQLAGRVAGASSSSQQEVSIESLQAQLQHARALIERLTAGGAREDADADRDDGPPMDGPVRHRSDGSRDNDTYYFNSYARSSIHAVRATLSRRACDQ